MSSPGTPKEENIGEKKKVAKLFSKCFRVQIFLVIFNSLLSMFIVLNAKSALQAINGVRRKRFSPGCCARILKEGVGQ